MKWEDLAAVEDGAEAALTPEPLPPDHVPDVMRVEIREIDVEIAAGATQQAMRAERSAMADWMMLPDLGVRLEKKCMCARHHRSKHACMNDHTVACKNDHADRWLPGNANYVLWRRRGATHAHGHHEHACMHGWHVYQKCATQTCMFAMILFHDAHAACAMIVVMSACPFAIYMSCPMSYDTSWHGLVHACVI